VGPEAAVSRRQHLAYVLLALGSAAYLYPFVRVLWRVGDEGTLVYGAARVAEGAVPYRDFFEVMGPGSFYCLALFFKLFGETWFVTRAVLLVTGVLLTLITYWLARRLGPQSNLLPAILLLVFNLPLWPATNHHWDSNLFALLSFAVFLLWVDTSRTWLLFAAGALAGITTAFMQQKGVLLLAAHLLVLWMLRRDWAHWRYAAARLLAGYLTIATAVVLYFYAAGALRELIYANIIWPFTNYHNVNSMPYAYGLREWYWDSWMSLLLPVSSPIASYGAASIFLLPLLLIAGLPLLVLILAAGRRSVAFDRATLPYWVVGTALWLSEIHRMDMTHLIYGSPVLLILCTYLWQSRQEKFWRYGTAVLAISVVLFAAFNALVAQAAQARMATRRGMVYTFAQDAALQFLDNKVQSGQEVFVYPYYPMYYFLSATQNPTRYSILMYHINTEAQFREVVTALEQKKVRYVLWDTLVDGPNLKQWFPAYKQPAREKLIMEPYLTEHYNMVAIKNGFRLLERKDEALDGAPDIPQPSGGGIRAGMIRR
jgi:hypothetical protein